MKQTFSYYPGCSLHATAREYDVSFRLVSQALGLELKELEGWVCCGASSAHASDRLLGVALPAHTLMLAQEAGLPLLAPCAACFSRLKFAIHEMEDKETRQRVERVLEKKLENIPPVLHPLQVLAERELPVKRPLAGLKVACYYGCLLVRPKGVTKFDDIDNPQTMDRLMQKAGAEAVAWPFKTECCGAGLFLAHRDMVMKLSQRILLQAKQAGAEAVAVACPMCQSNLDMYQGKMAFTSRDGSKIPVFYFTQLLGLALGLSPQQMMFNRHMADPRPLLQAKGLV